MSGPASLGQQSVFIVDNDPIARESSAAIARSKGARPEVFDSAEEFLAGYDRAQSGCLVTDMQMRGMSGLGLLDALSRRTERPPAIVFTQFADVRTAVRAMQAGAMTLIQKPSDEQELWEAIGQGLALDERWRQTQAYLQEIRSRIDALTVDENQVLDQMLAGQTNKGIARSLRLGLRTVEARRHAIMAKLKARSLAELVRLICEVRPSCASGVCLGSQATAGQFSSPMIVA